MKSFNCLEQECHKFNTITTISNTYDGAEKSYYECTIRGNLHNKNEVVTTNTAKNEKSNDEVTLVWYYSLNFVEFIPNSLFTTFINLEYLYIDVDNTFEIMKAEYLKNAKNLRNLKIFKNSVKTLDDSVFAEAPNLENINFVENKIESIHKLAFNGLPNLQGIYLNKNKITNLHPSTFTSITKLNILELSDNICITMRFSTANQKISAIESEIGKSCTYEPFSDEELAAKKIIDQEKN